ncbi:MAG: hypothetical protein H0T91_01595 [Propionibacteriaceae bacterium]|nr:hypothetical protein [Propionibacteriaceae bacterium]
MEEFRGSNPLSSTVKELIRELASNQDYLDVGLGLAIDRLLLELTRRLQQGPTNRAFEIHPAVHEVKTIIDREYLRGLSLKELADELRLAPTPSLPVIQSRRLSVNA